MSEAAFRFWLLASSFQTETGISSCFLNNHITQLMGCISIQEASRNRSLADAGAYEVGLPISLAGHADLATLK